MKTINTVVTIVNARHPKDLQETINATVSRMSPKYSLRDIKFSIIDALTPNNIQFKIIHYTAILIFDYNEPKLDLPFKTAVGNYKAVNELITEFKSMISDFQPETDEEVLNIIQGLKHIIEYETSGMDNPPTEYQQ